ncbi:hypothetical protein J5N97_026074 [Dioscorea zingiberensis]|uniref:Uncharacterized protein n=1 Tax=Dioscorea zingiberensis TaxID=325984 RepID=A0A9D5H6D6_9LILI|nr:hypothetical protein J5N97_026074 [Dioscorea zingiberensis]
MAPGALVVDAQLAELRQLGVSWLDSHLELHRCYTRRAPRWKSFTGNWGGKGGKWGSRPVSQREVGRWSVVTVFSTTQGQHNGRIDHRSDYCFAGVARPQSTLGLAVPRKTRGDRVMMAREGTGSPVIRSGGRSVGHATTNSVQAERRLGDSRCARRHGRGWFLSL